MPKHDLAFYGMVFFLIGILLYSIVPTIAVATLAAILTAAAFLVFNRRWLAVLAVFIVLGAAYNFLYDFYRPEPQLIFEKPVRLVAVVDKVEARNKSQKIVIQNIQITVSRYPFYRYGDQLEITGIIKPVPEEFRGYFSKERIFGLMSFPQIKVISQNQGSAIKAWLFSIKDFFENSYKKVLPREKAVFLSGLTLGSTAEFDEFFEEKLRLTGTSHLVALSGYNISIIVRYVGGFFAAFWVFKKMKVPLSILVVIGFVIMTGAEPSVMRAAIMAMILLLADQINRTAYIPNIISAAALAMVLINPKILVFDVGFQLSFAALIGIIYLEPWLRQKFKAKKEDGFLSWRSHFWTTTSAQLAVLPLLIYHFGFVSPVSILTNILLLEFIPITMGLGFFIGFAYFVNYWLAWIVALPAQAFLGYELTIINIFSKILNI